MKKTTEELPPLTPEDLAEIRERWSQDPSDLYPIHFADVAELRLEVERRGGQVAALLSLFTYESLGEPGRLYARLVGDVPVTNEVAAALAGGEVEREVGRCFGCGHWEDEPDAPCVDSHVAHHYGGVTA